MVKQTNDDRQTFRLLRPGASSVELVGSFTGWHDGAIQMESQGDGWWAASVPLEPGDYEFVYFVDGWDRIPDYAATGVKMNGFGQWVSVLTVEEAPVSPSVIGRIEPEEPAVPVTTTEPGRTTRAA